MFQRCFIELRATFVTALLMGFVPSALADPPEEELTAAPGSIAYGMIEGADAEGVFELVHDGQVTLRHVGSGLVCHFRRDGEGGRLLLFAGLPRGDDVGCDSTDGSESFTLYATRYGAATTVEAQMDNSRAELLQRFPNAQPFAAASLAPEPGAPKQAVARFLIARPGDRLYSSISLAIIGDWTMLMRYSLIAPDDAALARAELASTGLFGEALDQVMQAQAQ